MSRAQSTRPVWVIGDSEGAMVLAFELQKQGATVCDPSMQDLPGGLGKRLTADVPSDAVAILCVDCPEDLVLRGTFGELLNVPDRGPLWRGAVVHTRAAQVQLAEDRGVVFDGEGWLRDREASVRAERMRRRTEVIHTRTKRPAHLGQPAHNGQDSAQQS